MLHCRRALSVTKNSKKQQPESAFEVVPARTYLQMGSGMGRRGSGLLLAAAVAVVVVPLLLPGDAEDAFMVNRVRVLVLVIQARDVGANRVVPTRKIEKIRAGRDEQLGQVAGGGTMDEIFTRPGASSLMEAERKPR